MSVKITLVNYSHIFVNTLKRNKNKVRKDVVFVLATAPIKKKTNPGNKLNALQPKNG